MRNLKLISEARVQSPLASGSTATCSCICSDQGLCVIATDCKLCTISTTSGEVYATIDLAATGLLPSNSKVISLHCHADASSTEGEAVAVTIAACHGDLLVWHLSTSQVECVGSVESGIVAMCWSPDGEMLVLYTGAATIILMSKEFDPIIENEFHQSQFGSDVPVTVGWGKKETQFHGSEGKAAALTKAEGFRGLVEWDDLQPRVRWRGDGQFFAVLAVDSMEGTRKLRVWGRDGTHHSTSQIVDGCIEQALDWKPNGSLIATSQHRLQKHEVIFFERNGLRHGEFVLPFSSKDVRVKEVQWNSDSTVLMVWCEEINESRVSYVQLWTMGNYHWYLKHSICTCESDPGILCVTWDSATALRLHIVGTTGHYTQYNWSWTTSAASCIYEERVPGSDASVTVVDGDKLLVTPFKQMTVPPPLSAYSLKVDRVPTCIAVTQDRTGAQLRLAAVCGKSLFVFSRRENGDPSRSKLEAAGGKGFQAQCHMPSLVAECSFPSAVISQAASMNSARHLTWLSDESLAMAITRIDDTSSISSNDWLYVMSLVDDGKACVSTGVTVQLEFSVDVGGSILCIAPLLRSASEEPCRASRLAVELLDGTVLCWSRELGLSKWIAETTGRPFKFHVPCPQMAACSLAGKLVLCGLSDTYRFFIDEVEVATDCTSFAIHNDFLLLTTYAHTLRCIRRDCSPDALRQCTEKRTWCLDETIRRVERGSRIVTVVSDDTKVVLQMPRGNLEVVHPRALVLAVVRRALDGRRYREAFDLVRRHRISMNLLYDHDPSAFLENVVAFVQQIDQIQLLNEFITDLQKENVCSTMYAAYYPEKSAVSTTSTLPSESANFPHPTSTKVDVVCDSLYNAFMSLNAAKYTLSILAVFAKKTVPELEKALFLIKDLRASRDTTNVAADEALKYLLFLVDVHRLYNVALGTYDFELALMVAERSHMDPKEYLPFLNEVRPLEMNYQRFRIDQYLKRFERALTNLSKCGPERFAECLQFTDDHQLYTAAMMLYPPSSDEYKEMVVCYCKHLTGHKRFEEAGLLYMHVSQYSKAVDCFCESGSWQHLVTAGHLASAATRGHELPTQLLSSLRRAAGDLRRRRQFLDAARLLELHVKDEEEAVSCLVDGYLWEEALRVAHSSCRPDLEITHIRPAVESAYKDSMAALQGNIETFLQHVRRLRQVRVEKASRSPFESSDIYGPGADEEDELFSDAGSSVASGHITSSRRSGSTRSKTSSRSSKNRRKAERKKWSLKEGSLYEELALMEALKQLVEQADAAAADIGRHLRALVQFGLLEEATELQKTYESALNDMEATIPSIWPPEAWPCGRHGGDNETVSVLLQPPSSRGLTTSVALSAARIQPSERHVGSATVSAASDHAAAAMSFGVEQQVRVPPAIREKKTWSLPFLRR